MIKAVCFLDKQELAFRSCIGVMNIIDLFFSPGNDV